LTARLGEEILASAAKLRRRFFMVQRSVRGAVVAAFLSGVGAACLCAQAGLQTLDEPRESLSNGGLNHSLAAAPVTGQPFSAEQFEKHGRTLTDGTNILHFGHHFIARDSAGRIRVEQPCGCAPDHVQMVEVYVMDPVLGTLTTWRQGGDGPRIAHVAKWKPRSEQQATLPVRQPVANSSRPQPIITTDELPAQAIENLPMKATRITTVVPAGRSGNDRPITKTHTLWTSVDLKLVFMEQWEDPRTGVRTVGLANFSRKEPDPALFRPPNGYRFENSEQMVKELTAKAGEN